jgi:hypothetical protein
MRGKCRRYDDFLRCHLVNEQGFAMAMRCVLAACYGEDIWGWHRELMVWERVR